MTTQGEHYIPAGFKQIYKKLIYNQRVHSVVCGVFILSTFAIVLGAMQTASAQQIIYFNDFEDSSDPLNEWSHTATEMTPAEAWRFLGQFDNDTVSLSLNAIPPHEKVTVSFDLFIIQSWDGNNTPEFLGPDIWEIHVSDGPILLHTTFSAVDCSPDAQAYPDAFPCGDYPAGTGTVEVDTLGYPPIGCPGTAMDSMYHLNFTFAHSAPSLVLNFLGSGLQGIGDEGWGLDNVKVSVSFATTTEDVDGDGVLNDEDECANSALSATVVIDDCDSEVTNSVFPSGCTLADLLADCADNAFKYRKFVPCIAKLTNTMKRIGIITGQQKDAIRSCTKQVDLP